MPGMIPEDVTREERLDAVLASFLADAQSDSARAREQLLALHPDLQGDLTEFLAAHDRWDRVGAPLRAALAGPPGPHAGQSFGPFEILAEVGRGGMGVVFKARQKALGRLVALKLHLAGPLAAAEDVRRFQ